MVVIKGVNTNRDQFIVILFVFWPLSSLTLGFSMWIKTGSQWFESKRAYSDYSWYSSNFHLFPCAEKLADADSDWTYPTHPTYRTSQGLKGTFERFLQRSARPFRLSSKPAPIPSAASRTHWCHPQLRQRSLKGRVDASTLEVIVFKCYPRTGRTLMWCGICCERNLDPEPDIDLKRINMTGHEQQVSAQREV